MSGDLVIQLAQQSLMIVLIVCVCQVIWLYSWDRKHYLS